MKLSSQACKDRVSRVFFLSLFSTKNVKSILVFNFNCFYRHIFLHFSSHKQLAFVQASSSQQQIHIYSVITIS